MSYLSNETINKFKVLIEEYLIENVFKLDEDIIHRINEEGYAGGEESGEYFSKVLDQLFINRDFANFSISNKYIERDDIVEILRYTKLWYSNINVNERWYSQDIQWWHEGLDCDNDIIYIICWFVCSYSFINKQYIIELINKLCNIDTYVVLK